MRPFLPGVSSLLSPVLLAQAHVAEVEPNDTPATAQAILVGDQIDCDLAAGEQDWFLFTLAAAGRVRIHTSSRTGFLDGVDTRIALLGGTGTTYRAIDDDSRGSGQGWTSEIQLNIAAGSYMVQVVGADAMESGSYSLDVGSITPVVYDAFEAEPNDTHLTATPTGPLGVGVKRFHGTLSPNTTVVTGAIVDGPAIPPVVFSGVCAAPSLVINGAVAALPASTVDVTQTSTPLLHPAANPLLQEYRTGMSILMTSGINNGLARPITANTGLSVTSLAFPVPNSPGSTFDIVTANSRTVTWVGSLPLGSLFAATGGYSLKMTSGANAGLARLISANTGPSPFGSAITTDTFPVPNSPGNTFDIICTGSTQAFRVLGGLVPNVYDPTTGIAGLTGARCLGHYAVRFTSGANNGLYRQIAGNTGASISLASTLTAVPGAGDTFDIERVDADYYRIVLTAPNTAIWFQINEGDDNFVYGHGYELYDAAGIALLPVVSLSQPAFWFQSSGSTTTIPRSSSQRVWPAGTYYLAIRNAPT
ncbi:MAG TPA: DVUA0089 family protein, partial [Planctomycetota bacterium]|nr:DVUA0089 family protein [Planctomycetota bacterium]